MDNLAADFIIDLTEPLQVEYNLGESDPINCTFEVYASGTVWGSISGDINNQTDLIELIENNYNNLEDQITTLDTKVDNNYNELSNGLIEANQDILDLTNTVNSNFTTLNNKIDEINIDLSADKTELNTAIQNEATTRAESDTLLQNNINTLSQTVTANYNALDARITTNTNDISTINSKIPTQATSTNQLADKDFVNSSIATNTANFIGTFNSVAELEAYSGILTNNDYAFVATTDAIGNTLYDRYKWNGSEWLFEYELNNSSFTAQQWASINSGATSTNIGQITINANNIADLQTNKQDVLTAGANVQINNNVISATDTTYTAGAGISIENNVISNTQTSAEWGNITGTLSDQTDLQDALNDKYDASNPDGYINASALNGYATENWVSNQNYVNSTTLATTLNNYVLSADLADVATTGDYDDLINKPTEVTESTVSGWGFTKNVGTVTSVNSILPDSNGNVSIPISGAPTWGEIIGDITNQTDLQTALGKFVTLNTAQNISGRKTFLGEKAIYFKQQATSNKLGFTLYNPSNVELGALEYRPNTISGSSLLNLNCPQTTGGYVGFRYWGTPAVNIVAPKVATAGNYFMATHITNGTLTVTADNQGTVNISSLLPDVSGFATSSQGALADTALQPNDDISKLTNNVGYITSSALTGYEQTSNKVTSISSSSTDTQYPSAKCVYDIVGDIETLLQGV